MSPPRLMKQAIFHNNNFTSDIKTESNITPEETAVNSKNLHTKIVHEYLTTRNHNKITNSIAPDIHPSEETLPRATRTLLAQVRAGKSPLLQTYLHLIQPQTYSPLCPLCKTNEHTTQHLFQCHELHTQLTTITLWTDPPAAAELLLLWRSALDAGDGSRD